MTSDVAPVSSGSQPATPAAPPAPRPRLWPAVVLVGLYWAVFLVCGRLDLPLFVRFMSQLISTALLLLLFTGWWLINWRFRLADRLLGLGAAVAGGVGAA